MRPAARSRRSRWILCVGTLAGLVAVVALRAHLADRASAQPKAPLPEADPAVVPMEPRTVFPGVRRVVAVGDLHGDLTAARAALRLGGAIDAADRWIGGDLVVVQTGDEIDRGDADREIIDLFSRLEI